MAWVPGWGPGRLVWAPHGCPLGSGFLLLAGHLEKLHRRPEPQAAVLGQAELSWERLPGLSLFKCLKLCSLTQSGSPVPRNRLWLCFLGPGRRCRASSLAARPPGSVLQQEDP